MSNNRIIEEGDTFHHPICNNCKHWYSETLSCDAFNNIPEAILIGDNDHTRPLPEQGNTIIYEPKEN